MRKKTAWIKTVCENCNTEFEYYPKHKAGRFCSNACNGEYHRNVKSRERFEAGEITHRHVLKRYVTERDGHKCSECKIKDWRDKPIVFILDHIDGDPANNFPSNLRLICPNCNSQTPTFSGRNRGKGRKSRGLPTW